MHTRAWCNLNTISQLHVQSSNNWFWTKIKSDIYFCTTNQNVKEKHQNWPSSLNFEAHSMYVFINLLGLQKSYAKPTRIYTFFLTDFVIIYINFLYLYFVNNLLLISALFQIYRKLKLCTKVPKRNIQITASYTINFKR